MLEQVGDILLSLFGKLRSPADGQSRKSAGNR